MVSPLTDLGVPAAQALLACVGHTPLVELKLPRRRPESPRIFAKLESVNL